MCGICGAIAPVSLDLDLRALRVMAETLRHRGPDGAGEALVEGAGLHGWIGHRRLKILDLSELAHQPMASLDGRIVMTYNGEVYNFRELREELAALGHPSRSSGDAEVVLRAYEAWGPAFVERLDGMFAIAVWDGRDGSLLLCRDRTGKKPLFYAAGRDGQVAFGSEIKAVLACPWVERRADHERLAEYLTYGYVPNPATFLQGVVHVPPASTVRFERGRAPQVRRYWSPLPAGPPLQPTARVVAELRERLDAATRRRMVADVPLGALLSGGMDSSVIVALMARASAEPIHTFAIGFVDDESYDERRHAQRVATHLGTRHTEYAVRMDAAGLLDRLVWHHDQPFQDSSAVPTYIVSALARQEVTVVLTGDGGDEVFGGYDRFRAAALSRFMPPTVARAVHRGSRLLPTDHGYYGLRRRLERFAGDPGATTEGRYESWISVINREWLAQVLPGAEPPAVFARLYAEATGMPPLDRILHANFSSYLPDDLAVKMDRTSMAHSLEARSPFLDTALVEYTGRIRARHKVGLRQLKPLLRAAFEPLLPDDIWNRRKHGFGVPMGTWFRGALGPIFEDEVLGTGARCAELLDPRGVQALWRAHQDGTADHGAKLWTLLTLERWLRTLEAPPQIEPPAAGIRDLDDRLVPG
jgi:asparagine synthase (glutamine-hydrolysing)